MKKETKKILKISAGTVAAVLLLVFIFGFGYFKSKLNLLQRDNGETGSYSGELTEEEKIKIAEQEEEMRKATEKLEERGSVAASGDIISDENVFNILLIGTDERTKYFNDNARGDSCMLLSINKKTNQMSLVSFERGSGVPILGGVYAGQWDWLTHTFRYGGADLMMKEIRECYKIDVNRYIRVNFATFIEGIDSIGGVDINMTKAEADFLNSKDGFGKDGVDRSKVQVVYEGPNHLNGTTALLYSRLRKIDSDWYRVKRQRSVVQAAVNQVRNLSVSELDKMLNTVLPIVKTNLTDGEIASLMLRAPSVIKKDMQQMTVPVSGTYGSMKGMGGRSLISVNFAANSKALRELLYPDYEG